MSPPLGLSRSMTVASYGPEAGEGEFVLTSTKTSTGQTSTGQTGAGQTGLSQGVGRAEVVGGPGQAWAQLPTPPAGTATLAFGRSGSVDAFAVDDTQLGIWSLDAKSASWVKGQVISVPIQFGSSG